MVERVVLDVLLRVPESLLKKGGELRRRDQAEPELLGAPPERLVLVVEDLVDDVAPASEVDVAHIGLALEDGAHEVREVSIDLDDLLKLIEDHHDAAPSFC